MIIDTSSATEPMRNFKMSGFFMQFLHNLTIQLNSLMGIIAMHAGVVQFYSGTELSHTGRVFLYERSACNRRPDSKKNLQVETIL